MTLLGSKSCKKNDVLKIFFLFTEILFYLFEGLSLTIPVTIFLILYGLLRADEILKTHHALESIIERRKQTAADLKTIQSEFTHCQEVRRNDAKKIWIERNSIVHDQVFKIVSD